MTPPISQLVDYEGKFFMDDDSTIKFISYINTRYPEFKCNQCKISNDICNFNHFIIENIEDGHMHELELLLKASGDFNVCLDTIKKWGYKIKDTGFYYVEFVNMYGISHLCMFSTSLDKCKIVVDKGVEDVKKRLTELMGSVGEKSGDKFIIYQITKFDDFIKINDAIIGHGGEHYVNENVKKILEVEVTL